MFDTEFGTIWTCLTRTAPAFLVSSSTTLAVGVSLSAIQQRSDTVPNTSFLWPAILFSHLLPILLAPIFVVQELLVLFERYAGIGSRNSTALLGFYGYLFHSLLAYVLLNYAFSWRRRIDDYSALERNIPARDKLSKFSLFTIQLAPPLSTTLCIIFIFHHSMISAPFFMSKKTVASLAIEIIHSASASKSLIISSLLIFIFLLSVATAWLAPKLLGSILLKWSISRRRRSKQKRLHRPSQKTPSSYLEPLAICLGTTSALISGTSAFLVVQNLLSTAAMDHGALQPSTLPAIAASMLSSPAVRIAAITPPVAFVGFLLIARLNLLARFNKHLLFRSFSLLALAPPSLLGVLALSLITGRISLLVVGHITLAVYLVAALIFLAGPNAFLSPLPLINNSRTLGLPRLRKLLVIFASDLGTLAFPFCLAAYFLWIEDGIQVTVLQEGTSLAERIRGLRHSPLTNEAYIFVILSAGIWLFISTAALLAQKNRAKIFSALSRVINRKVKPHNLNAYIVYALLLLSTSYSTSARQSPEPENEIGADPTSTRIDLKRLPDGTCLLESLSIESQEVRSIGSDDCTEITINSISVNFLGSSRLEIASNLRRLTLKEIDLRTSRSIFTVAGTRNQANTGRDSLPLIEALRIPSIKTKPAEPSAAPTIRVADLRITRLRLGTRITGTPALQDRPVASIQLEESAEIADFLAEDINIPNGHILISPQQGSSIRLSNIAYSTLLIAKSSKKPKTYAYNSNQLSRSANIFISARATPAYSLQPTKLTIQGLNILRGEIKLETEESSKQLSANIDRAVVELHNLAIATNNTLQIDFPEKDGVNALVEVQGESLRLGGKILLNATHIDRLTLWKIVPLEPQSDAIVEINASFVSNLDLHSAKIGEISICKGSPEVGDDFTDLDSIKFRNVQVLSRFRVSRNLLKSIENSFPSSMERIRFFEELQRYGEYCDDGEPVGIEASYLRKKADLEEVSFLLAHVMDNLTGLGVKIKKPLLSFFLLCLLHFTFRFIVIFTKNAGNPTNGHIEDPGKQKQTGASASQINQIKNEAGGFYEPTSQTYRRLRLLPAVAASIEAGVGILLQRDKTENFLLQAGRRVFDIIIFFQITACSVYFSQTTLQ